MGAHGRLHPISTAPLPEESWLGRRRVKLLLDTHAFIWWDGDRSRRNRFAGAVNLGIYCVLFLLEAQLPLAAGAIAGDVVYFQDSTFSVRMTDQKTVEGVRSSKGGKVTYAKVVITNRLTHGDLEIQTRGFIDDPNIFRSSSGRFVAVTDSKKRGIDIFDLQAGEKGWQDPVNWITFLVSFPNGRQKDYPCIIRWAGDETLLLKFCDLPFTDVPAAFLFNIRTGSLTGSSDECLRIGVQAKKHSRLELKPDVFTDFDLKMRVSLHL